MKDIHMHITLPPSRHRAGTRTAAALLAIAAFLTPTAAWAQKTPPPGGSLIQTIDANEPITRGEHAITTGHVDMGPKFDGTTWKFLIHDDAARANKGAQSVWRYPTQTVLQVVDAAKLTVPDNSTYSFVGAEPGAAVWVVPQTQNPDVVWAGWNTQDPTVMQKIDRGATFSVDGVQGPGVLTVYLQSGDFGAPQVLWDSRKTGTQDVFVDTNTHTHANWVFTKPGVYLVRMSVAATLVDGTQVTDTELLRFAVGSATPAAEALKATWAGATPSQNAQPSSAASAPSAPPASDNHSRQSPLVPILIVAIAVVTAALITGFTMVIVRDNQAKKRALTTHAGTSSPPAPDDRRGA